MNNLRVCHSSQACSVSVPAKPETAEPPPAGDQIAGAANPTLVAFHHPTTSAPFSSDLHSVIYTQPGSHVITRPRRRPRPRRRRQHGVPLLRDDAAAPPAVRAAAAQADHPGAARREPGQPGHGRLHHHPGLPHPAHPAGRRAGARGGAAHPGRRVLRPRRQLEGPLLRVPLRAHPRHAAGDRARLPARPRHRRPRGVPRPGAGLRKLPGRGADARRQGDAPAVRPLLLPLPRGRVRRRRLRSRRQFPGVSVAGHRHGEAGAGRQLRDQPGDRLARAHVACLPHEVVQVDGGPVRAAQQLRQLRVQGDAAGPRRRVLAPRPPHQGGARELGHVAGDDRRPAVARLRQPPQLGRGVLLVH